MLGWRSVEAGGGNEEGVKEPAWAFLRRRVKSEGENEVLTLFFVENK